jgi:hypothetical protein
MPRRQHQLLGVKTLVVSRGTASSNPLPSSGESANSRSQRDQRLEKLIAYEAVHEIQGWGDLRSVGWRPTAVVGVKRGAHFAIGERSAIKGEPGGVKLSRYMQRGSPEPYRHRDCLA